MSELSEEEKKAIEYWKRDISLYHYNTQLCSEHYAQTILNLIEKQSKEIEYWKKQAEGYSDLAQQMKDDFENRDRWE